MSALFHALLCSAIAALSIAAALLLANTPFIH